MLVVALSLSAIAAFYSIIGLTAIFAAAVIPVAIMGSILEIAKLVVTVWLHEYWQRVKWTMRAYLVPAVAILMLITSMGIFGFLSKAHLDQAVPAGDVSAQVTLFDEKIKTQRDNIEAARAALRQLDAAVDQTMGRSADEKGAERAVQIRRGQQAERTRLQTDIQRAQTEITRLQEQRAPIAAQARKVEAEVGPIKYIAALIYGDNPDDNLLEKAVRWVIIILVMVFDPLAIFMLLAATESWRWEQERRRDDGSTVLTREQPQTARERLQHWRERITQWRKPNDTDVDDGRTLAKDLDDQPPGPAVDDQPPAQVVGEPATQAVGPTVEYRVLGDADDEEPAPPSPTEPKSITELKGLDAGQFKDLGNDYVIYQDKIYSRQAFDGLFPDILPRADDTPTTGDARFGTVFPREANRGDLFVRVDYLPTRLFKFNGKKWIEVNKGQNTSFAHNEAYLDLLMEKLASGEYDIDMLNSVEREQLENKLKDQDE